MLWRIVVSKEDERIDIIKATSFNVGRRKNKEANLRILPSKESMNASLLLFIPIKHADSNPWIQQRDKGNIKTLIK